MNNIIKGITAKWSQIKRVWDFLPLIWKGKDYDYRYAIDLFTYQLERLANFMESDRAYTLNADIRAKRIRTAIKLLKKVYEEDYGCEYQDKVKELYGESDFEFVVTEETKDKPKKYRLYTMETVWERDYTEEEKKQIETHKTELFHESQNKQEKAHRILWSYIEHNIREWWD